ncbi:hypothetical protein [Candidatus Phytoplasma asteris]|uniref:hypothetical protein n=1 Tax=Candidatus Phytoplasma asteris TaxID=85620 RepID=UPI00313388B1
MIIIMRIKKLNQRTKLWHQHLTSCMYIHGGAGSGKTTILIEKLRQKEKTFNFGS